MLAAVAAGCFGVHATASTTSEPTPLSGVPLTGATGLRLLVADKPPFVLDVDRGTITRIRGLNLRGDVVLSVLPVGKHAAIWLNRDGSRANEIYVVRAGATRARRLGTAATVAAAADGRSVWMLSPRERGRCTLRRLALDGRTLRGARRAPCTTWLDPGGSSGLVFHGRAGDTLIDPASGRTLLRAPQIRGVVGELALTTTASDVPLSLTSIETGRAEQLSWPSDLPYTDDPAVRPDGGLVTLAFADPAYPTGGQALDLWLLDPATRRLKHLPDMPASVSLKSTSMSWTQDGRLVLLAETANRDIVAVWRPGDDRIAVRRVRLPVRSDSGSDSFAIR